MPRMTSAASLHRPAIATSHLFRNRGGPVPARRRRQAPPPPLRMPASFLRRAAVAKELEQQVDLSPRLFEPGTSDGESPRGEIAAAWRRLHGGDDWSDLLDPLHPDLRREIVSYGEFVDAAYGAFLARPDAAPGDAAVDVPLRDEAYRVTAPLFATSSVGLPPWLSAASPSAAQRTSLVGYVAVCESPVEVRRMGRRDIVVALRGTCTVLEWAENVRTGLVPATDAAAAATSPESSSSSTPKVGCGLWNLYKTAGNGGSPSLSEMVVSEIRRLLEKHEGEELSVTVTGHSLGAALAVLIADELAAGPRGVGAPVAVFSFGGPRVGDAAFAARVDARGGRVLRMVNAHDVVPRLPPAVGRRWWPTYADVGRELRLDSRASPYLRPDANAACCHDLEAYIHLVDGFLGSHCPFRANSKRSVLRLLKNQRGNVKQPHIPVHLVGGGTVAAAAMPGSPLRRDLECIR